MRIDILRSFLLMILAACSPRTTPTGSDTGTKYSEDLSVLRPEIETPVDTSKNISTIPDSSHGPGHYVEARHSVNDALNTVLDSIDRINVSNGLVDGYTIQLYSGVKREEALNVKKQLAIAMPDMDASIQYVQPNFRVRIGKYIDRLKAYKDYMAVKKYFPNAIIIPERIPIN